MEDRHLCKARPIGTRKQWVTGFYAVLGEKTVIIVNEPEKFYDVDSGKNSHGNKIVEVISKTVCRCTAMPDKNKKLVFEHDIVWDSDERAFYEIIWNQEDMCWNVEDADGYKSEFEECYGSTIEVNGNRFDNPELFGVSCFQNGNS